jgi:hypothetical protein
MFTFGGSAGKLRVEGFNPGVRARLSPERAQIDKLPFGSYIFSTYLHRVLIPINSMRIFEDV